MPVRPATAPPGSCPGETGPRPASTPQRPPRNPPCCSTRCLAPFATGGAGNPGKDVPLPLLPQPRGSVYPCKYLMVIASGGRELAPAPGGAIRASRDTRGAATRRPRREGRHPSLPETPSAPFCVTDLGRGRQERREEEGDWLNHTGELSSRLPRCHGRNSRLLLPRGFWGEDGVFGGGGGVDLEL